MNQGSTSFVQAANTNSAVSCSKAGQKTHERHPPESAGSCPFSTQDSDLHQHRHEYLPRLGETSLPSVMKFLVMGTALCSHFCTLRSGAAFTSKELVDRFPLPVWKNQPDQEKEETRGTHSPDPNRVARYWCFHYSKCAVTLIQIKRCWPKQGLPKAE